MTAYGGASDIRDGSRKRERGSLRDPDAIGKGVPASGISLASGSHREVRERQAGWLTSAFGVGPAGGLVLGAWGGFRKRIFTTLAALVALGVVMLGLGLTPQGSSAVALAAIAATGVVVPFANGPVLAILQATVAPGFQGRVFTLIGSLAGGTAPVGLLLATPVAEIAGPGAFYLVGGAICAAMGTVGFFSTDLVRIEEATSARPLDS